MNTAIVLAGVPVPALSSKDIPEGVNHVIKHIERL